MTVYIDMEELSRNKSNLKKLNVHEPSGKGRPAGHL